MRALLLAVAVAAACASPAAAATIVRGDAANGSVVTARAGDVLVVRLAGNPTTGYRWSTTRVPAALRLLRAAYVAPPAGVVGRGGTFVFRFAVRGGTGTLSLGYRRPWEKAKPPLRTYSLHVRAGRL